MEGKVSPPGPWNRGCLVVFAPEALAPGPGKGARLLAFVEKKVLK
jgi:hypothetical protein